MSYISWSDDFSVKVEQIDAEHKNLVNMINALHQALLENRGKEVHMPIVLEMIDYASYHFATEENYMRKFGFLGYLEHKAEHDRFVEKVTSIRTRLENNNILLTLEILSFLREWLWNHIMKTDKAYSGFFNKHGLH